MCVTKNEQKVKHNFDLSSIIIGLSIAGPYAAGLVILGGIAYGIYKIGTQEGFVNNKTYLRHNFKDFMDMYERLSKRQEHLRQVLEQPNLSPDLYERYCSEFYICEKYKNLIEKVVPEKDKIFDREAFAGKNISNLSSEEFHKIKNEIGSFLGSDADKLNELQNIIEACIFRENHFILLWIGQHPIFTCLCIWVFFLLLQGIIVHYHDFLKKKGKKLPAFLMFLTLFNFLFIIGGLVLLLLMTFIYLCTL